MMIENKLYKELIETFVLDHKSEATYVGRSLDIGSKYVYGGHVLAQAIIAADHSISDAKELISLHSYFLLPGDRDKEISYAVTNLRDGRSFASRKVTAFQNGKAIYELMALYQIREEGLEHSIEIPNVPSPESLSPLSDVFERIGEQIKIKPKGIFSKYSPVVLHSVEDYNPLNPGILKPIRNIWFRPNGPLPKDQNLRRALIAYISDFSLLITSLFPHNKSIFQDNIKIASLDHSMWFHNPIIEDDWMLYAIESPVASSGRGFCTGRIFSRKGKLLCSVAQEGLIRVK